MAPPQRLTRATPLGLLGIRAETAADEPFLFHLFTTAGAASLAALPLPEIQRQQLLRLQFTAMRQGYRQTYPAARFEIVSLGNTPIGTIVTNITPTRIHYVDIAILPENRRQGLATTLMQPLLAEPAARGLPAEVSVMAHNTASLALCHRLGFIPIGETPPHIHLRWTPPAAHGMNPHTPV